MSDELVEKLLVLAQGKRPLDQSAYLFHRDDPVKWIFVVEEGRIDLIRPQPDGKAITLQRASQNAIVAEASLYSTTYHCDGVAALPSVVAAISKSALVSQLANDRELSLLWSAHLAAEMQKSRCRSEILSRKTVAERLDAWLNLHNNILPAKGEWKNVSSQIGVSPEALYRELSKRR